MSAKKDITLLEIFDAVLDQPLQPLPYTPKPKFRPSDLGSPCLRKIYYSYNRVLEDYGFPLKSKKIVMLGDKVHDILTDTFRKAGIVIDYRNKDGSFPKSRFHPGELDLEFPVKDPDLKISGKVDAVFAINGVLWIGEFKSMKEVYWNWKDLKKPKTAHLLQAIIYYFIFNNNLKEGKYSHIPELKGMGEAKGIKFVYYNKNTSEMKEFVVEGGKEIFIEVIEKMNTIKQYTIRKELPPTAFDFCKTCSWRKKCVQNKLK